MAAHESDNRDLLGLNIEGSFLVESGMMGGVRCRLDRHGPAGASRDFKATVILETELRDTNSSLLREASRLWRDGLFTSDILPTHLGLLSSVCVLKIVFKWRALAYSRRTQTRFVGLIRVRGNETGGCWLSLSCGSKRPRWTCCDLMWRYDGEESLERWHPGQAGEAAGAVAQRSGRISGFG